MPSGARLIHKNDTIKFNFKEVYAFKNYNLTRVEIESLLRSIPKHYFSSLEKSNFGLDLATGDYIVFFDSDDLMTVDHVQVKYDLINSGDYDFGITRTEYFNYTNEKINKYYNFTTKDISKENYILKKINWLTLDVIIKSTLSQKLRFNEYIKTSQEYNYYSKLLCYSENGIFLNKTISLRRHHENSKRSNLKNNKSIYFSNAVAAWFTYLETSSFLTNKIKRQILFRAYKYSIRLKKIPKPIKLNIFLWHIAKIFKFNGIIKMVYFLVVKYKVPGYFLKEKAMKS